jgi:hypothetical protein
MCARAWLSCCLYTRAGNCTLYLPEPASWRSLTTISQLFLYSITTLILTTLSSSTSFQRVHTYTSHLSPHTSNADLSARSSNAYETTQLSPVSSIRTLHFKRTHIRHLLFLTLFKHHYTIYCRRCTLLLLLMKAYQPKRRVSQSIIRLV